MATTDATSDTGRFARWWASWRVAIRIALRDARRYRWRSALIVAMVGLPVLLLTGGITLLATKDISMAESVPRVMGSAQARISDTGMGDVLQSPQGQMFGSRGKGVVRPLPVPGFAPRSGWTSRKVQRVIGGRVLPTFNAWMRVTQGDRRPLVPVLGIDARDPAARGMTELVSGRWPATSSEVVVTSVGILHGLPSQGRLIAGSAGKPRQLRVVGVATCMTDELPLLVALPDLVKAGSDPERLSGAFLVSRAVPVSWSDVRKLNDYGLLVKSRHVFLNPPPTAGMDPLVVLNLGPAKSQSDTVLLLAAVLLFIETTLLAGPAFAVSAARQRRSLALAASNGAEAGQLRRCVLGQAVVLGVVSSAVAVVAGLLLTRAALTWWLAGHADFVTGPFEVSWWRVMGVFVCAVVAAIVGALLPAKGIARLDIVSVLAGRVGDRTVRRGLPAGGVVVMVLSGFGLIWAVASGGPGGVLMQGYLIGGGAVGIVLGCLMVIPAVLALVGRLATHLALPLRLAARDTGRQRGRATPAVAAVMAAVAAMTALSIGAASYSTQQEAAYKPQRPMGTGYIELGENNRMGASSDERSIRAVLDRYAPQLRVDRLAVVVDTGPILTTSSPTGNPVINWVRASPPRCTEDQILAKPRPATQDGPRSCPKDAEGTPPWNVGSLTGLSAELHLSTAQRAVLVGGGVLTSDPTLVRDRSVRYVAGIASQHRPDRPVRNVIIRRDRLRAMTVKPDIWYVTYHGGASGVWILSDTATKLGWPVMVTSFNLTSPTGMISTEVERAVADRIGDGNVFAVERGYPNPARLILIIAFSVAGLLVLIASLISTALSLAESQNDMATLAAVGATRHTRRAISACQALVVAACGCVLGVAVGIVPGIASTWPLTTRVVEAAGRQSTSSPVIVIPWLPLFCVVVLVPMLAAGLAWLAVRRHPQMTRRLA